jgi:thiol-disulfide isomerase/thioredoxin
MKSLYLNFVLLCFSFTAIAQTDTIHLKETTSALSAYSQEADSIRVEEDTLYEYFSFISTSLLPSLKHCKSINIKIKTIKNITAISQYQEDEISSWQKAFKNNSSYEFIFQDSNNIENNLAFFFEVNKMDNVLTLRSAKAFYGKIEVEDTLINFRVRPFILSKNNIQIESSKSSSSMLNNALLYGETFRIKDKYYQLSSFNIKDKSIVLNRLSAEIGKYGYKISYFIKDFEVLKKRIQEQATTKVISLESEYYLFYFWGEWCYPCQKKIPYNKEFYKKIDTARLKYINVALSLTDESESKTLKVIKDEEINGIHLIEGKKELQYGFVSIFNNASYPTSILLNKEGKVLYRSDNFSKNTLEAFLISKKLLKLRFRTSCSKKNN